MAYDAESLLDAAALVGLTLDSDDDDRSILINMVEEHLAAGRGQEMMAALAVVANRFVMVMAKVAVGEDLGLEGDDLGQVADDTPGVREAARAILQAQALAMARAIDDLEDDDAGGDGSEADG